MAHPPAPGSSCELLFQWDAEQAHVAVVQDGSERLYIRAGWAAPHQGFVDLS